jgi:tRNA nucleotidyltransferase (CCA-adding enzyme)
MLDVLAQLEAVPGGAQLRQAAAVSGQPTYLVGGAVRDLLLGRAPRELDVAVEGDPEPLVAALGGDDDRHPRFGTAVVRGDGWRVDIARCRRETYARPGALPEVEPADIETDLTRRDATVNAIAVSLAGGGQLAAPNAQEDLRNGLLRVLHDRSFHDDPTRLWRVARYRARLGFELEPHTAALAAAAIDAGALGTVSGARIGNELRLALGEDDPVAALTSARDLGLAPWARPDAEVASAARSLAPDDARADLVVLGAVFAPEADPALLEELGFPGRDRDAVGQALAVRAGRHRPADERPSAIAEAYRGLAPEAVALAGPRDREAAHRWLAELRHLRLQIDGDDLLAAGLARGPGVGARLRATLAAVLDGDVAATRDAQIAAAMRAEDASA